jgi:hypothetical protein
VILVDRYVAEVARRLPRSRRADISRELRSVLLDALDSRVGPAPSEDDVAALLREFGPPEKVAASYRPSNEYLIGPALFGPFRTVLRIHLLALVSVLVGGFGLLMFVPSLTTNVGRSLASLIGSVVQIGLFSFGAIVLLFHLLERSDATRGLPEKRKIWNPRDLPDTKERDLVGRGEALTVIVITAVYLSVLYQLKNVVGWTLADGRILLSDVYRDNLPWIGASALLTMLHWAVLLWQGRWRWYTRVLKLAFDAFGLYVVYRIAIGVMAEQQALLDAGIPPGAVHVAMQICSVAPVVTGIVMGIDNLRPFVRGWFARGGSSNGEAPSNGKVASLP